MNENRNQQDAWLALSWVGYAFVVMGVTDIVLGWYPTAFGNAEWEFGVISAALNGFALPTLGLYLILGSAIARRQRIVGRALAIVLMLLTLFILGLAVVYVTVVPLALSSVAANGLLTIGMHKAIIKAGMLFVAYVLLLGTGALRAWKAGAGT